MLASFVAWLKRSFLLVNLSLSFMTAVLSGLWINWWTGGSAITPQAHSALGLAVVSLILQIVYNRWVERIDKALVHDVLRLVHCLLVEHAKVAVRADDIRLMVHLARKERPGKGLANEWCLIPRYELSPVRARDCGAIPLDRPEFKRWYVNVRAFHKQDVVCEQPDASQRPSATGHFVNTPSLFRGMAVISVPIRSPDQPPVCLGTLTADSPFGLDDLYWPRSGASENTVTEFLFRAADLIGRIQSS